MTYRSGIESYGHYVTKLQDQETRQCKDVQGLPHAEEGAIASPSLLELIYSIPIVNS